MRHEPSSPLLGMLMAHQPRRDSVSQARRGIQGWARNRKDAMGQTMRLGMNLSSHATSRRLHFLQMVRRVLNAEDVWLVTQLGPCVLHLGG